MAGRSLVALLPGRACAVRVRRAAAAHRGFSTVVETRRLAGMEVGRQGLGCMGLSAFYESAARTTETQAVALFNAAVQAGVTLFNTATFYGPLNAQGYGHNLRLLRKCLSSVDRSKVQIMLKVGLDTRAGKLAHKAGAADLRAELEYACRELGTDYVDIAVLNREDAQVPLEESVAALAALQAEGRVRHLGLSEFNATNIRAAHAVAPIACIEQEWSLMARDIEDAIVPACRELGIAIVAYSPVARGLLTGALRAAPKDFRGTMQPRFAAANLGRNLQLVDALAALAAAKGVTVPQLALAWVHAQGGDVFPIPGTSSVQHLVENVEAARVHLTRDDLQAIERACPRAEVAGDRYGHPSMTFHGNKRK